VHYIIAAQIYGSDELKKSLAGGHKIKGEFEKYVCMDREKGG
jgi:hypothetical protein